MKFLFLYKGSNGPQTDDYMKEWMDWLGQNNLMAVGSQLKGCKTVGKDGVADGDAAISGYSQCAASSLEEAVKIAQGCPGLKYGDSVEVLEEWSVQG